jgi:hypothetical protein
MRILNLVILIITAVTFFAWGYFTYSRQLFPYSLISREAKIKSEKEEIDLNRLMIMDTVFKYIDPYNLIRINKGNIDSITGFINNVIFGPDSLRKNATYSIEPIKDPRYNLNNLNKIDKFTIQMKKPFKSVVYIFNPSNSNNKVVIYHQGHYGDFIKGKNTIAFFLNKGYTVFALSMPLLGKNTINIKQLLNSNERKDILPGIPIIYSHEHMKLLDYPLSYFIQPAIQCITYAVEKLNSEEITMIGVSGGAWTTTIAAAIDNRIMNSFSVAGTYPLFIRVLDQNSISWGDFEQTDPTLFKFIDYLDLYVLASSHNRKHYQIVNEYDPRCFKNARGYLYQGSVNKKNKELDFGEFIFHVDTINKLHSISDYSLNYIYNCIK